METKLKLNKEVIAKLNDDSMNRVEGGGNGPGTGTSYGPGGVRCADNPNTNCPCKVIV